MNFKIFIPACHGRLAQCDFHIEIGDASLFCLLFESCNVFVLFVFFWMLRVCVSSVFARTSLFVFDMELVSLSFRNCLHLPSWLFACGGGGDYFRDFVWHTLRLIILRPQSFQSEGRHDLCE